MESGYLRKAMKTFQRIVRLHKGSVNHDYILCEVTAMMGMIHYTKGNYSEAYNVYNRSLQLRLRLKDYGCSTMAIFNNVACLNYFEGRFEQSVQMLKQGWHLSGRSDNYDLLLRTNLGMVLMTKNHLQEAKYQLELINTC